MVKAKVTRPKGAKTVALTERDKSAFNRLELKGVTGNLLCIDGPVSHLLYNSPGLRFSGPDDVQQTLLRLIKAGLLVPIQHAKSGLPNWGRLQLPPEEKLAAAKAAYLGSSPTQVATASPASEKSEKVVKKTARTAAPAKKGTKPSLKDIGELLAAHPDVQAWQKDWDEASAALVKAAGQFHWSARKFAQVQGDSTKVFKAALKDLRARGEI